MVQSDMMATQHPSSSSVVDEDLPGLVLADARRIFLLCQRAEKVTPAEIAYGAFLTEYLEDLVGNIEWVCDPGTRVRNPGPWLKKAGAYFSDLGTKFADDGTHDNALADGAPPRWQLAGNDMVHFVNRLDRLQCTVPTKIVPEPVTLPGMR